MRRLGAVFQPQSPHIISDDLLLLGHNSASGPLLALLTIDTFAGRRQAPLSLVKTC